MFIDFHTHSSYTAQVTLSIKDLVGRAKEIGIDGFCLTDVHSTAGAPEAKQIAAAENLVILVGFEAHTNHGHYLVFVPEPQALPPIENWLRVDEQDRLVFSSLVQAVMERKGILIAAHPYDRALPDSPGDSLVQLEGVSAVEVLNGRRPSLANELAEEVASGVGLPGVGGSDIRNALSEMGRAATLVRDPLKNESDLIARILSYDVWPVTIGDPPLLVPVSSPQRVNPDRTSQHRHQEPRRGQSESRQRNRPHPSARGERDRSPHRAGKHQGDRRQQGASSPKPQKKG